MQQKGMHLVCLDTSRNAVPFNPQIKEKKKKNHTDPSYFNACLLEGKHILVHSDTQQGD